MKHKLTPIALIVSAIVVTWLLTGAAGSGGASQVGRYQLAIVGSSVPSADHFVYAIDTATGETKMVAMNKGPITAQFGVPFAEMKGKP